MDKGESGTSGSARRGSLLVQNEQRRLLHALQKLRDRHLLTLFDSDSFARIPACLDQSLGSRTSQPEDFILGLVGVVEGIP